MAALKVDDALQAIAGALQQEKAELLAALKALVYASRPNKYEHPAIFEAWRNAHDVIAHAERAK